MYSPDVWALAEELQAFEDASIYQLPAEAMGQPPSLSNLNRAKHLIEHGYTHSSWKAAA